MCHASGIHRPSERDLRGLLFFCREDIVEVVPWDRPFAEPVELPKGKKLVTLRDAALYITKLPKAEHDAEEWQAAMLALLLVAVPRCSLGLASCEL
jgi:hypothetical protein